MEEGKLAGIAISQALGLVEDAKARQLTDEVNERIAQLRNGSHGEARRQAKEDIVRGYYQWKAK